MFRPDVIVRAIDRPEFRIAVKVEAGRFDVNEVASQLQRYMKAMACPLGLLVAPQKTHIYEETYRSTPNSIREFAVVNTPELIGTPGSIANEAALQQAVWRWLETMTQHPGIPMHHSGDLVRVEDRLLPVMVDAELAVTGLR
jgi:hypothetical protein